MDKPRLWTKDFIIDSATNFCLYLAYYLLIVTITVYASDNLQASPSEAGLAAGIFILGILCARLLAGKTIEKVGRKRTLFIGLVCYLATTFLYFGVDELLFLIIVRFLHGVGFGVAGTATGTIIASIIPASRRGEGISYYAMSATLASAIGPFLGMYLYQTGSFNIILVLNIGLLVVSLAAVLFLQVPEAKLTKEQLEKLKGFALETFFEAKAVPIAVISLFIGLGFSGILGFLTSYTRHINLVEAGRFFFIVYAIFILFSRPLTGRWFDQKGENYIMYPSFLLFVVGMIILSQAEQGAVLLTAAAFIGLGYGTFVSGAQAIAIKGAPHHRIGLATSTFFAFIDFGAGIGPFLLGFAIPPLGYRGLYLSLAAIVAGCMALYYFIHGRTAGRQAGTAGES